MKKKKLFVLVSLLISLSGIAQESTKIVKDSIVAKPKLTAAIDLVYPYLWRGVRYYGDDLAVQPFLNYSISDKLSVGVWATTNLNSKTDSYFEFDWSITYQVCPILTATLADYYWPATVKNQDWERSSYFDYSDGSAKTLDFSLLFDFFDNGVPIDITWSTLIGGGDFKGDEENRKRAFSSFTEVGYTYSFESTGVDVRPFVGAAVLNEGGYYGEDANGNAGFTFTNVGVNVSKEIKFSEKFLLPVFVRYSFNNYGVQEFDSEGNLTRTIRNFFSCGVTFNLL